MELVGRVAIGTVLLPVLGLGAWLIGGVLRRLVDVYAEGLAVLVCGLVDIHGEWPAGEELFAYLARIATHAAAAGFWVIFAAAVLLYPQVRWLPEGTAALTFVIVVFAWIPAAFLQHVFRGRQGRRHSGIA